MEASTKSSDPQEVTDLQDDHLMHRDEQEPQPEPEASEEVLTNDIEKDPPPTKAKRPRSKAQQEAFKKAQAALKAKREAAKAEKSKAPKKTRGRPVKREPKKPKKKETTVVFEESSDSDYSVSESSSMLSSLRPGLAQNSPAQRTQSRRPITQHRANRNARRRPAAWESAELTLNSNQTSQIVKLID